MSDKQVHLSNTTSTYLLQHHDNLDYWGDWLGGARKPAHMAYKPILLSVQYGAYHWHKVMANESHERRR